MTGAVIGAVVALAFILLAWLLRRRTRPTDGVEQFQRQIDALSPAARRPVVDKVHQLDVEADVEAEVDEEPDDPGAHLHGP